MSFLLKRRSTANRFALVTLLFLAACTFSLPQLGTLRKGSTTPGANPTATTNVVIVQGASTAEVLAPTSTQPASSSDQPGGGNEISARDFSDASKVTSGM